eukprot:NODE_6441_length_885_cov_46.725722_g5848_i0.p1 GENE.NODE_6441_length_885_cov_46.725722_g5848_i0~~NODE_6441_length_885_cov_46.725722_g5848_i0.p1  ORF type:complete len:230 (-),score=45.45 NODE_6441_length_885_cov_46.725722_g5848_i0:121-810(-)
MNFVRDDIIGEPNHMLMTSILVSTVGCSGFCCMACFCNNLYGLTGAEFGCSCNMVVVLVFALVFLALGITIFTIAGVIMIIVAVLAFPICLFLGVRGLRRLKAVKPIQPTGENAVGGIPIAYQQQQQPIMVQQPQLYYQNTVAYSQGVPTYSQQAPTYTQPIPTYNPQYPPPYSEPPPQYSPPPAYNPIPQSVPYYDPNYPQPVYVTQPTQPQPRTDTDTCCHPTAPSS